MRSLTVSELVDLLAQEIAAGRGDREVLVSLPRADERALELLDLHNWSVTEVSSPDDPRDRFIVLHADPD